MIQPRLKVIAYFRRSGAEARYALGAMDRSTSPGAHYRELAFTVLADENLDTNQRYNRAVRYAKSAVSICREQGSACDLVESLYDLGSVMWWGTMAGIDTIDAAIAVYGESALIAEREGLRELWTKTLGMLAVSHYQINNGNREHNVDTAITYWRASIEHMDLEGQVDQYLAALHNLAIAYTDRVPDSNSEDLERAIECLKTAERVEQRIQSFRQLILTRISIFRLHRIRQRHVQADIGDEHIPLLREAINVAMRERLLVEEMSARIEFATCHLSRPEPSTKDTQVAIDNCRHALTNLSREISPAIWARANDILGSSLRLLRQDIKSLREAKSAYECAITVYEEEGPRIDLVEALVNLGLICLDLTWPRTEIQAEEALSLLLRARQLATPIFVANPNSPLSSDLHARILSALGSVYSIRIDGDHGDNIEHAVQAFQGALRIYEYSGNLRLAAIARTNFANTLLRRVQQTRSENAARAIELLDTSETSFSRTDDPIAWAITQQTLGVCYGALDEGDPSHIERAIQLQRSALNVLSPETASEQWLRGCNNLAGYYLSRSKGDRVDNAHNAINILAPVLDSPQIALRPLDQASAMNDLGHAYSVVGRENDALESWTSSLEVLSPYAFADLGLHRRVAIRVGDALAVRDRWREATWAYSEALRAQEALYDGTVLMSSEESELSAVGDLAIRAAYAGAKCGLDGVEIALILERNRARRLRRTLNSTRLDLSSFRERQPEEFEEYRLALEKLREIESTERNGTVTQRFIQAIGDQVPDLVINESVHCGAERLLASEKVEVLSRIQELLATADLSSPEHVAGPPTRAHLTEVARNAESLVYVACSEFGTLVLICSSHGGQLHVEPIAVGEFQAKDLDDTLGLERHGRESSSTGGTLAGQLGYEPPMLPKIWEKLDTLGRSVVSPIAARLAELGTSRVTLIPCGLLGLLPLHAVRLQDDLPHDSLIEQVVVRYAPSAQIAANCQVGSQRWHAAQVAFAGIASGQLAFAEAECRIAANHFADSQIVSGSTATESKARTLIRGSNVVHFACHGTFRLGDPLSSYLVLDDEQLSLRTILSDRLCEGARLVVAAACQTALSQFSQAADEVIGLSAGFLASGVSGVVATLWPVDDLACALLMSRFYMLYSSSDGVMGLPDEALRGAQLWLRSATARELALATSQFGAAGQAPEALRLRRVAIRTPDLRYFGQPRYWAPFVFIGA